MNAEPNRILIVDDDEAARYVKSRLLRRQGYAVSEASLAVTHSLWPLQRSLT